MHAKVIVIGDDPEAELEPFYEHNYETPQSKWDYHCLGWFWVDDKPLVTKSRGRVERALKLELDMDAMDPTLGHVLLLRGVWHTSTTVDRHLWPAGFAKLFATVKGEELVSVYDCHS